MRLPKVFFLMSLMLLSLSITSCARTGDDVWEDSKSCGRHVGRGFAALGGKHGDSRQVRSSDEFTWTDQSCYAQDDFIPLMNDQFNDEVAIADMPRQSAHTPGDPLGRVPGIEAFTDPENDPQLSSVFKNIHFPFDSNLVKGRDNFMRVAHIADYMKKNPGVYVFVEGHCDERGAEAYNLALGSRRANAIRSILISEGVNPDNIFTISYGKERPVAMGHDSEAWSINRRGAFKVYRR